MSLHHVNESVFGSNGMSGPDARSTVALLLVSTASSGTPLEAWLMPVCGDSRALCVSSNVLGAALFRPYQLSDAFLPLMVTADKMNEKEVILEVQPLVESLSAGSLGVGDVLTCAIVDQRRVPSPTSSNSWTSPDLRSFSIPKCQTIRKCRCKPSFVSSPSCCLARCSLSSATSTISSPSCEKLTSSHGSRPRWSDRFQ